jgi:hypothetical protein
MLLEEREQFERCEDNVHKVIDGLRHRAAGHSLCREVELALSQALHAHYPDQDVWTGLSVRWSQANPNTLQIDFPVWWRKLVEQRNNFHNALKELSREPGA